jgi:hypothetical protein
MKLRGRKHTEYSLNSEVKFKFVVHIPFDECRAVRTFVGSCCRGCLFSDGLPASLDGGGSGHCPQWAEPGLSVEPSLHTSQKWADRQVMSPLPPSAP